MDDRFLGLNLIPAQTVVLNADGNIIFVNDAWIKFAEGNGYLGAYFLDLNYIAVCEAAQGAEKPQAELFARNLRAVLEGTLQSFELVYPCHGSDIKRWFKSIAKNQGDQTVVTHVDISFEYKHFLHVSQFYENAKIMHDLRSPLTAILGFSEFAAALPADQQSWAKALEYFEIIQTSGSRMLEVTDEILDFSRKRSLEECPAETIVPLRQLGQEIQKMFQPLSERNDVHFDLDISEGFAVRGDGKKLWKIFTNLVSNAIKYNRPDGSVTMTASFNGAGGIEVKVKDTGIGMLPETIDTIFEPFTRLSDSIATTNCEGTGLGLAIVRDLVLEHDGNIIVSSIVDVGTEFILQFPGWRTAMEQDALTA